MKNKPAKRRDSVYLRIKEKLGINDNDDDIVVTEEDKKQFINKMVQYRNTAITFIGNNKKDLASIYLQHSNSTDVPDEDRCGVLGINLVEIEDKNNVDVAFIPTKLLHIELVNQINERKKGKPPIRNAIPARK